MMTIEQLKNQVREALQSAFEWRCGLGTIETHGALRLVETAGGPAFAAPDDMEGEHIAAANLLGRLVDDVDNLHPAIGARLLELLNSYQDPSSIFEDGRFDGVIQAIGARDWSGRRWRPQTVTDLLRQVLADALI
jgi:hypothetical protein